MLVSATPPLLALGFFTTIKGSLPPRAKACSSSFPLVWSLSLSNCTSLEKRIGYWTGKNPLTKAFFFTIFEMAIFCSFRDKEDFKLGRKKKFGKLHFKLSFDAFHEVLFIFKTFELWVHNQVCAMKTAKNLYNWTSVEFHDESRMIYDLWVINNASIFDSKSKSKVCRLLIYFTI